MKTITIIDSHTGGEPTRLVTEGGPDLGNGPLDERLALPRYPRSLLFVLAVLLALVAGFAAWLLSAR